jgi:carbon monoxide dehydrogenase subunit G
MADSTSTSSSISIDAPPSAVLAVIADFDSYPAWAGVKDVEVLGAGPDGKAEQVTMTIDAGIIKGAYTLAYRWAEDSVSWSLVESSLMRSQEGSYRLQAEGECTRVDYALAVDLAIPMPGIFKRKGEKVIVDTALKGLKKRVESL